MTTIRSGSTALVGCTAIPTKTEAFRGDTKVINIQKLIPAGYTVRSYIRTYPASEWYVDLDIVGQTITLPATLTINYLGRYVIDVEMTDPLSGKVETIQQTKITFLEDVTRDEGEIPNVEDSDFERNKIIAKSYWIRSEDGSLTEVVMNNVPISQTDVDNWNEAYLFTSTNFGTGERLTGVHAGKLWEMSLDDDYLYVCVLAGNAATAKWKKFLGFISQ